MRRFLILILCCVLLTGTVFAAGWAGEVRNTTVVYTDGSADVVLKVNIVLEEKVKDLAFPLPRAVENVRLDGAEVDTYTSRDNTSVVLVDLDRVCREAGEYDLEFRYTLPALIHYGKPVKVKETVVVDGVERVEEKEIRPLELELPLLSGFAYPVQSLNFSVKLPEGVEGGPIFESGYLLQSIESDLDYTVEDGVISGVVTKPMKDKETLRLTMTVDKSDFPELVITEGEDMTHLYYMTAVAGAAMLFWLLFLRSRPVVPLRTTAVPAGIHAGEVASRLTMEGADLTMMIFQWAQLGYIRIRPDKRDRERVWLHKRMEMGNERTPFEVQTFRQLFGRKEMVEGTGSRCARLNHQVASTLDCADQITLGGRGGRVVFRGIAVLASTLCGAAMGQNIGLVGSWQMAAMMVFAMAGSVVGWKIQSGAACLHLRRKDGLPAALLCAGLWIAAALLLGRPKAGFASICIQVCAGIFAAWGGRRTRGGWQMACQLLGLRHYLTSIKRQQIQKELDRNPDYFFEMAPYALALGVEDGFAKRFGRRIMPQCGYLEAGRSEKRTAQEWAYLMRQTAEKLDNGAKRNNK